MHACMHAGKIRPEPAGTHGGGGTDAEPPAATGEAAASAGGFNTKAQCDEFDRLSQPTTLRSLQDAAAHLAATGPGLGWPWAGQILGAFVTLGLALSHIFFVSYNFALRPSDSENGAHASEWSYTRLQHMVIIAEFSLMLLFFVIPLVQAVYRLKQYEQRTMHLSQIHTMIYLFQSLPIFNAYIGLRVLKPRSFINIVGELKKMMAHVIFIRNEKGAQFVFNLFVFPCYIIFNAGGVLCLVWLAMAAVLVKLLLLSSITTKLIRDWSLTDAVRYLQFIGNLVALCQDRRDPWIATSSPSVVYVVMLGEFIDRHGWWRALVMLNALTTDKM